MFINSNENYHFTNKYWNNVAFKVIDQHFIRFMPQITIQLLIKQNVCCTNDIITKGDDNNRLVRLVLRLGLVVRV